MTTAANPKGGLLRRWLEARLLWPSVAALFGLAVLIGLGTWQLQRKAWKEGIIAKIEARVTANPVPLDSVLNQVQAGGDVEYLHVIVKGRFHYDKERYLYAPGARGLAWEVLTPLEWAPGRIVWVNRGLVPDARKAPDSRREGQVQGIVSVTGLLRRPQSGTYTPRNDVARNIWYFADNAELTRSGFADGEVVAVPAIVEADASATPAGGLPAGGVTRLAIPNRHLEYVLTWYGLGLTLVGVFVAFARSRLRNL